MIVFPDTVRLAEFILMHKVKNAEVNTNERSLLAPLTDTEIITACTKFEGALLFSKATTDLGYNDYAN